VDVSTVHNVDLWQINVLQWHVVTQNVDLSDSLYHAEIEVYQDEVRAEPDMTAMSVEVVDDDDDDDDADGGVNP